MDIKSQIKSFIICIGGPLLLASNTVSAQQVTIENSSVAWQDAGARTKLLERSPSWNFSTIDVLFKAYKDPRKYHLPKRINGEQVDYNALFIHSFWGPKENPFAKVPRPAKAFLFVENNQGAKQHFMAPIMRYKTSSRYYVYELDEAFPITVEDWVTKHAGNSVKSATFNICNGYGAKPSHSCNETYYENEIYTYPTLSKISKDVKEQRFSMKYPSAKRQAHQDWHSIASSIHQVQGSVIRTAVDWNDKAKRNELIKKATQWSKYKQINKVFKKLRDTRYFQDENDFSFGRRITWLWPDDGCWTRVSAMLKDYFGPEKNPVTKYSRPSKVFVFGNMCVKSKHVPDGKILWWYHTVPFVRDKKTNRAYVIDPAVNNDKPLLLEDWVKAISANDGACASDGEPHAVAQFNVCNGYGPSPFDSCEFNGFEDFGKEISNELLQKFIRVLEYDRQIELGRDPKKVLGNKPPWK